MEKQYRYFNQRLSTVSLEVVRPLIKVLNQPNRMIGIKGARGVGKTTLLLQYAKQSLPLDQRTLYVSLDDPWFSNRSLTDFADDFVKQGGTTLLLDEVHHYPNWSEHLKFIYDQFPGLRILFTGSSVLHIDSSTADLSRRAVFRTLYGLSFREYLNWTYGTHLEPVPIESVLADHLEIARTINEQIKPIKAFREYRQRGVYPFSFENNEFYLEKLRETSRIAIESDIRSYHQLGPDMVDYLLKLLSVLADTVPLVPNITKLSERIGTTRNTLIHLLDYLEKAQLIHRLYKQAEGITRLQKPDKLYLNDSNLMFALSWSDVNKGALRETFFVHQVRPAHSLQVAKQGDFIVDENYIIEVGGKNKTNKQIRYLDNAYIASDDIEYGYKHKIPLWMFGLLY